MDGLRHSIIGICFIAYSSVFAQDNDPVDFIPSFKKGDRLVYQIAERQFKQNGNGHFLYLMYDTSYMVFNVTEKNDTQTLIDCNFADAIIDGKYYNESINPIRTETYKLVLDQNGEFIELNNWEFFASVLIQNTKILYANKGIDSNTLKYYYLYYHNQENVEKTVLPRIFDLFSILGKTYQLETNYSLAREMVNPFRGKNLLKSCTFKPYKEAAYTNSIFFAGKVKTTSEDNDCLQEDYYAFLNEKKPDADSDIVPPYIHMEDTYYYQWGVLTKRILYYAFTHYVYLGEGDKQGIDRTIRLTAQ